MSWPTPQDYNEAVQNPQTCFSDPELKQGMAALTPLGLPKPISGAFASVYRLDCPGRRWAVRCFLREYADQKRRYSEISDRLRAVKLPCMVGFEFLTRGILVGGRWYPVLKMEWIDGEPFNDYIARNLNQTDVLRSLSRKWIDLMASLRKAQIAHGDLQHGNILVTGGELKLIDYDAMYVPALAGLASHEEGHRNHQHPGRTGRDYHADLDNFSAWVIFTSISALAIEPRLWKLPNAGDECLLFRREDFERPWSSKAIQNLEANGNFQLQTLVSHFRSIVGLPLSQVPSLEKSILDDRASPDPSRDRAAPSRTQGLPSWLGDHVAQAKVQPGLEPLDEGATEASVGAAAWLYDHLIDDGPPPRPLQPTIPIRDRIALRSFLGLMGILVVLWGSSLLSGLTFFMVVVPSLVACGAVLILDYRATNPSAERAVIRERLNAARSSLAQVESAIGLARLERTRLGEALTPIRRAYEKLPQTRDAEIERLDRDFADTLRSIDSRRRKAQEDHGAATRVLEAEAGVLDRESATALEGIEVRRHKAREEQKAALKRLEQRIQKAVAALTQKRGALDVEEGAEVSRLLQESRTLSARMALSRATLSAAVVSGVGEALVQRLRAAGISCASDVTYDRVRKVSGIGDAKANGLVAWRRQVEDRANSNSPRSLSPAEAGRIREKYASSARSIDQQISALKGEERSGRQQVLQGSEDARRALDAEDASIRREFAGKRDAQRARHDAERSRLTSVLDAARRTLDSLEATEKRDHGLRRDAVMTKYEAERARLAAEFKAEKSKAAQAQKRLDETLDLLNRSLFQRRLEVRQAERELDKIKVVRPLAYLRMVLLPRRTA